MPELEENRDRDIVPRWRRFHSKSSLLEAAPLRQGEPTPVPTEVLDGLIADWKRHRTFSHAADLLGAAAAIQKEQEVRDAAQMILDDPRPGFGSLRKIARSALGMAPPSAAEPEIMDREDVTRYEGLKIGELRSAAMLYPRNPFLWLDLAFTYEVLGLLDKAKKAIRVASNLAPENRSVLRSTCRFLFHREQYREAYELLKRAHAVRSDPWILSAFLASSRAAERPPLFVKSGRRMLDTLRFGPFRSSELASAVGMLELSSGKRKRAQKLLNLSLVDPTENAIAQAFWAARRWRDKDTIMYGLEEEIPPSAEARAWQSNYAAKWEDSLTATWRWLADQPFSARPAIHGSYIASRTLRRHEESARIAWIGLLANPGDATLINNYAFSMAQTGNVDLATRAFRGIKLPALKESLRTACTATKGLLCFRDNRAAEGRAYYREAIDLAKKSGTIAQEAAAKIYLAMEELRAGTPEGEKARQEALELAESVQENEPDIRPIIDQLRRL